jgi:hypothetical protein
MGVPSTNNEIETNPVDWLSTLFLFFVLCF